MKNNLGWVAFPCDCLGKYRLEILEWGRHFTAAIFTFHFTDILIFFQGLI